MAGLIGNTIDGKTSLGSLTEVELRTHPLSEKPDQVRSFSLPSHPTLDAMPAKESDQKGRHKKISIIADANRRRFPLLMREDTTLIIKKKSG